MLRLWYYSLIWALLLAAGVPGVSSGFAAAEAAEASAAPKLSSTYALHEQFILIEKSTNTLTYFEKGKAVKSFKVATGKKPSFTPEGLFLIHEKVKNRPYYKEKIKGGAPDNPLGARWLGLNVKINGKLSYAYAIHGTNSPSSIGTYSSAGCIRMHNEDVIWLYDTVKMNTPVLIR
ncbi:ErfK/YbiS/YcfS/YnhG family protein [Paenibacillus algicola]|uniref:ErfK/YbiS/YcfS/YnhG family protein n=1 Tax=Paenibacillus algicola TaxID=2565926 RepID=A0A4P8XKZ3_9BACL|nr:L,D-transpeptidase [Paenibacillus algicola]QCT02310.1 ErfK/YbiS/YcfS/YnhG family protein [Paenibacillus algicola]